MANIQSQKKRNRQSERARLRNKSMRSELKTRARTAIDAAESGETERAQEALRDAHRHIDVAASKGILHKRTAARRKSRLAKQVNKPLG